MNGPETVLAVILVGGGTVYLAVCLFALIGLILSSEVAGTAEPTVSVIIAARNAEGTIGCVLDDLLGQDYPPELVEIIPVDDDSRDRTHEIIRSYASRESRIKAVDSRNSRSPFSHKKKAVHEGILSSVGEIVMTVDSDCRIPEGWIRGMIRRFTPGVELVAGEVRIEGRGLIAQLETLEFTGIQCMAAGLANMRFPITCNGANLAYRRAAFERVNGFEGIGGFVSGDDDLLMQKIARGNPARVVFSSGPETAVRVTAVSSVREFLSKRTRWASKIRGYSSRSAVALLGLFFGFFTAAPIALMLWLAGYSGYGALAAGYGLKTAGDALLTGYGLAKTGNVRMLLVFPLAELLHVPYILSVTLNGWFGRFEWRGRRTGALAALKVERADEKQLPRQP